MKSSIPIFASFEDSIVKLSEEEFEWMQKEFCKLNQIDQGKMKIQNYIVQIFGSIKITCVEHIFLSMQLSKKNLSFFNDTLMHILTL